MAQGFEYCCSLRGTLKETSGTLELGRIKFHEKRWRVVDEKGSGTDRINGNVEITNRVVRTRWQ